MQPTSHTHRKISPRLVGAIVELLPDKARVLLETQPEMVADDYSLVHGGFIFGLADYAAMLAVNEETVVLGSADSKFLAPVKLGDVVEATAIVVERAGKKIHVECSAKVAEKCVFQGKFTCFVLEKHVLA